MNFVMNYAPGAGSIPRPVDQQSSVLPLYYGCPHFIDEHIYLSLYSKTVNKWSTLKSVHTRHKNKRKITTTGEERVLVWTEVTTISNCLFIDMNSSTACLSDFNFAIAVTGLHTSAIHYATEFITVKQLAVCWLHMLFLCYWSTC